MLTLSPVWHGRLRAVRGLTNLLLQALVIHPALLFFLLFLLMSHHAGSAGMLLLSEAERLVRDAPAGQVWGCVSQATPVTHFPTATPDELQNGVPAPEMLKPAPPPVMCDKGAVSRDAWAEQTSGTLFFLYQCGVLLSILSSLAMWIFRRRVTGDYA